MAGSVSFTPDADDYTRALLAHLGGRFARRQRRRLALVLVAVSLLLGGIALVVDRDPLAAASTLGGGLLGGFGVMLLHHRFLRWWMPRRVRTLFGQQRSIHREHHLAWDAAGARWHTDAGDTRLAWGEYHGHLTGPQTVLLYLNAQLFHYVPRHASGTPLADLEATIVAGGVPAI